MTKEVEISELSKITVGLCITILGLSFWMGVAWAEIGGLKSKMSLLDSIDRRLSRIEGKLGVPEQ